MLPAARDNARLNGYRGLQFPWQSGLTGGEVTPYYCAPGGGIHEQFVIPCIAFAFAQYLHATGDDLFRRQSAWPVLEGIADWICSRVLSTPRGYEILHVVGNDESVHDVDNHALTNGLCAWTLREAARQAEALGMTPPARWRDIAEGLFLPVNPQSGALEKHEHDPRHLTKAGPAERLPARLPGGDDRQRGAGDMAAPAGDAARGLGTHRGGPPDRAWQTLPPDGHARRGTGRHRGDSRKFRSPMNQWARCGFDGKTCWAHAKACG
jgi:hypothetical protein